MTEVRGLKPTLQGNQERRGLKPTLRGEPCRLGFSPTFNESVGSGLKPTLRRWFH